MTIPQVFPILSTGATPLQTGLVRGGVAASPSTVIPVSVEGGLLFPQGDRSPAAPVSQGESPPRLPHFSPAESAL